MDKQQILSVLQAGRFGMTAKEVAKEVGQPTADVGAALFQMESAGDVTKRLVGRESVWSVKVQSKSAPKKRTRAPAAPAVKAEAKPMPMPRSPPPGGLPAAEFDGRADTPWLFQPE